MTRSGHKIVVDVWGTHVFLIKLRKFLVYIVALISSLLQIILMKINVVLTLYINNGDVRFFIVTYIIYRFKGKRSSVEAKLEAFIPVF